PPKASVVAKAASAMAQEFEDPPTPQTSIWSRAAAGKPRPETATHSPGGTTSFDNVSAGTSAAEYAVGAIPAKESTAAITAHFRIGIDFTAPRLSTNHDEPAAEPCAAATSHSR